MQPLQIHAPAKINLTLHVIGKRADGYHLLESLVAFAACGDVLELAEADDLSLTLAGPFASALPGALTDNLVMKAAMLLRQATGHTRGAQIILHKHLPVGAGIGGGSADAAAALKGLCALWNIPPAPALLQPLAAQLGSDVPVCLSGAPAWMCGIGEDLLPIALPETLHAVLVNPLISLPTPKVFQAFRTAFNETEPPPAGISANALLSYLRARSNALEAAAISLLPELPLMLTALRATAGCRLARMSGSGATCFGLYEDAAQTQAAVAALQSTCPNWWIVATTIGNRHE